jgi:hypothetical protein
MKTRMGKLERQFFAVVQTRGVAMVRTGELAAWLQIQPSSERKLLYRLSSAGWIARVRRGLYLAPSKLPLGGKWSPDVAQALNALIGDKGGLYQICGPNAFQRHGYDGQIPTRVYAYNNRLSGRRRIGSLELVLIKVADARLGSIEGGASVSEEAAVYSSRVRTLVDALDDWARFASLPRAFGWIREDLATGHARSLSRSGISLWQQGLLEALGRVVGSEWRVCSLVEEDGSQAAEDKRVDSLGSHRETQGPPGPPLGGDHQCPSLNQPSLSCMKTRGSLKKH